VWSASASISSVDAAVGAGSSRDAASEGRTRSTAVERPCRRDHALSIGCCATTRAVRGVRRSRRRAAGWPARRGARRRRPPARCSAQIGRSWRCGAPRPSPHSHRLTVTRAQRVALPAGMRARRGLLRRPCRPRPRTRDRHGPLSPRALLRLLRRPRRAARGRSAPRADREGCACIPEAVMAMLCEENLKVPARGWRDAFEGCWPPIRRWTPVGYSCQP
jgi:hypothetical protein